MSIFNNSDLNYNYDGNGVDINNFEDPDYSITEKIDTSGRNNMNRDIRKLIKKVDELQKQLNQQNEMEESLMKGFNDGMKNRFERIRTIKP
jgi:predicted RNase H-like nuclease (RuvC/YqgF family)